MYMLSWLLVLSIIVTLLKIYRIDCGLFDNPNISDKGKFRDVCAAMDHLRDQFPREMSLNERCKRYAYLLSETKGIGMPHESFVLFLLLLDETNLEEQYKRIDVSTLTLLYMNAIDKYRVIGLGPAFIDLVECLRMIDTRTTRRYLNNQELIIILDLYKRVLGLPDSKIDIHNMDSTGFHPGFRASLRYHFDRHMDLSYLGDDTIAPLRKNAKSHLRDMPNVAGAESLDPQEIERRERLQMRARERQRRYRERHILRQRERSRLARQRQKMLDPEAVRESNKICKEQARERRKRKLLERTELLDRPQRYDAASSSRAHEQPTDFVDAKEVPDIDPYQIDLVLSQNLMESPLPSFSSPVGMGDDGLPFDPALCADQGPHEVMQDPDQSHVSMPRETSFQPYNDMHEIEPTNYHDHELDQLITTLQTFQSEGMSPINEGPLDFATQMEDTEALMQLLMDDPPTAEPMDEDAPMFTTTPMPK